MARRPPWAAARSTPALMLACLAGAVLITTYSRDVPVDLVQTASIDAEANLLSHQHGAIESAADEWQDKREKMYKAVRTFQQYGDSALEKLIPARKSSVEYKKAHVRRAAPAARMAASRVLKAGGRSIETEVGKSSQVRTAVEKPESVREGVAAEIALLAEQQKEIDSLEAKLASANRKLATEPRGTVKKRMAQKQGSNEGGRVARSKLLMPSQTEEAASPRLPAEPWEEGVSPERGYEVARFASMNGPQDLSEIDGDKVADWNDFFDNMNARVDAPRWGKKNMIIDNIEDIEPCRVDCDRDGGDDLEDFDFFHDMLTLNDRGHIVDNLDDIDACTIDC